MTLKRTEMARGTTPMRNTKPMSQGTVPMNRGTAMMSRGTALKPGTATMSRGTGLKRSGVKLESAGKIKAIIGISVLAEQPQAARQPRKRPMKTTRPKMTAIRQSAQNKECTLRFPCCNYRIDTTVLCHRNGAGGGMKAPDTDAAYGCYPCHQVLDGQAPRPEGFTREAMLARFDVAVRLTHIELAVQGLIRLLENGRVEVVEKQEQKKQKPLPAGTGNGFNSNQLIGQSMSKKIVPHINSVECAHAPENSDFSLEIPSISSCVPSRQENAR